MENDEVFNEKGRLKRDVFGGGLSVYEAGQMDLEGKQIDYEKGIKLSYGNKTLKVSAFFLLGLAKMLSEDDEIRSKIHERAKTEQDEYLKFQF